MYTKGKTFLQNPDVATAKKGAIPTSKKNGFLSLDEASLVHEIIEQSTSVKWVFLYAPFLGMFL